MRSGGVFAVDGNHMSKSFGGRGVRRSAARVGGVADGGPECVFSYAPIIGGHASRRWDVSFGSPPPRSFSLDSPSKTAWVVGIRRRRHGSGLPWPSPYAVRLPSACGYGGTAIAAFGRSDVFDRTSADPDRSAGSMETIPCFSADM